MPSSHQARSVAGPRVHKTFQKRTVGEAHSWTISTNKIRVLVLDWRLMVTVLVARAVLVNEWMFMHEF